LATHFGLFIYVYDQNVPHLASHLQSGIIARASKIGIGCGGSLVGECLRPGVGTRLSLIFQINLRAQNKKFD